MTPGIADIIARLKDYDGAPVRIMEVCGTHTRSILRGGVRGLISPRISLVSGPGCPVCVTVSSYIDKLIDIAKMPGHTVVTFGDMLKVPGSRGSLQTACASDGVPPPVVAYSPMDVLRLAEADPASMFVFAAVGFETTIAPYAALVRELAERKTANVRLLTAAKVMPPALDLVCRRFPDIDAFIAPGNVSVIIGADAYSSLAERYRRPFAICGFSTESVLTGIYDLVAQVRDGTHAVHNLYPEYVRSGGNRAALDLIAEYFEPGPVSWRGFGEIPDSGLYLRPEYAPLDAGSHGLDADSRPAAGCLCDLVISGRKSPRDCGMFMNACRPLSPYGACMAAEEGACRVEAEF